MLTTASFFNSVSMSQIETLFGALPSGHGKLAHKPEVKQSSARNAAPASTARNVVSEALQAIQALTSGGGGAPSLSPVSPAARYDGYAPTIPADGDTRVAQTTIEGSLGHSSYAFSFAVDQRRDSETGGVSATSYSYTLSVDGHFVTSGWVNGGRDPSTDPVQIKLGFSYAETSSAAFQAGGSSAQAEAFSTVAGQITIDAGSMMQGSMSSSAMSVCSRMYQSVDLNQAVHISSNVAMTSGSLGCASWLPATAGGSSYSQTTQTWSNLLTNLQITWGA